MTISPVEVAEYLQEKAYEKGKGSIGHVKLQKLVFIIHGHLLISSGAQVTLSEQPERVESEGGSSVIYWSLFNYFNNPEKSSAHDRKPLLSSVSRNAFKIIDSIGEAFLRGNYTNADLTAFSLDIHPDAGIILDDEIYNHFIDIVKDFIGPMEDQAA